MSVSAAPVGTWGPGSAMSALETIMWRAEVDPALRSTMAAVEVLEQAPRWDTLEQAHRRALSLVPRLRERVVEPLGGLSVPRWSIDPHFDLAAHLHRAVLPAGAGWSDFFALVERILDRGFDRERPPWEAVLVEGLPGGRAGYVLKLHHASTDGIGTLQLMLHLHGDGRAAPELGTPPEVTPGRALVAEASELVRLAPRTARRLLDFGRQSVNDPVTTLRGSIRYGLSLQRVLSAPAAAPSTLLAARSPAWRLAALDVDLEALRAVGANAGGSLNDAYLAALLGGYRRYHEAWGVAIDEIPMAIPISVRREGDPAGGNRFASARMSGPIGIADPAQQIAAIHRLVRSARDEPAVDHLGALASVLSRLPAPAIAQVARGMAGANDLQASNVPGLREDVHLAGVRVERLYPYAPRPGCPAMITLLSHGDTCCVGVNYDPAAITDGELFLECLVEGFVEVLELVGRDDVRWVR